MLKFVFVRLVITPPVCLLFFFSIVLSRVISTFCFSSFWFSKFGQPLFIGVACCAFCLIISSFSWNYFWAFILRLYTWVHLVCWYLNNVDEHRCAFVSHSPRWVLDGSHYLSILKVKWRFKVTCPHLAPQLDTGLLVHVLYALSSCYLSISVLL